MKKPKITEGKWEIGKEIPIKGDADWPTLAINAKDHNQIFEINTCNSYRRIADAKAISAVPEMIGALLKARQCYQGVVDFESCGEMMSQIIPEIDEALLKAGCKPEEV